MTVGSCHASHLVTPLSRRDLNKSFDSAFKGSTLGSWTGPRVYSSGITMIQA